MAAQRQFLVKVLGVEGTFASKSGGRTAADTSRHFDGGSKRPETMAAPAATENVTVGRIFRPVRDRAVLNRLRPLVGIWRTNVSVQDLDGNLIAVPGGLTVYTNALLVGLGDPDHDAESGDPARLELEFSIEDVE
jgi:hypothetical protein